MRPSVVRVHVAVQHGLDSGDRTGLRNQRQAEPSGRGIDRREVRADHHRPGIVAQTNGVVGALERDLLAGETAVEPVLC